MSEASPVSARPRIVVGTDGSAGARAAVTWAADEASRRGCELLLVHVPHVDARIVDKLGEPLVRAVDEFGRNLLDEAADEAAAHVPGLAVTTLLAHGTPADVLVGLSADAELVVAGSRGSDEVTGTLIGSVSHRVATHASCPVAIVPSVGTSGEADGRPVVAGVSGSAAGRQAARLAAHEAAGRGTSLRLIFACAEPTNGMMRGSTAIPPHLDEISAELRRTHPGVPIAAETPDGEPVEVLLEAAGGAQLLVLGCHRSTNRWSTRLGPVPSMLLHRVTCPVLLVGA